MSSFFKSIGTIVALLLLLVGAGLIGYSRWSRPIAEGDAALEAGQLDQAITSYASMEARFDAIPAARQLFKDDYHHAIRNQLWALYRLGRFDETIARADQAPEEVAPHFWMGTAFFQKAQAEEKPDEVLGLLTRAEEELRKAVEAAPNDWDTKFDFELTTKLAAAMRKEPKTPPKQMMQLLRPQKNSGQPVRRVP